MPRQIWLASTLRGAGVKTVEVDGWKTRGSDVFAPVGVTWHATAGSRTSTAAAEIGVLINGRPGLSGPIAQLFIDRDGTVYVVAAGRCNHNLTGWAGPNKGLGNHDLIGIEMANDNKGQPWPAVQLDAARKATAAIMRHLGANPLKRLAAHYEHQPAAGHPAGQTSFKTDPLGVLMVDERPRVAAIMNGDDDMPSIADIQAAAKAGVIEALADAYDAAMGRASADTPAAKAKRNVRDYLRAVVGGPTGDVDEAAIAAAVLAGLNPDAITAAIPDELAEAVADKLAARLAA